MSSPAAPDAEPEDFLASMEAMVEKDTPLPAFAPPPTASPSIPRDSYVIVTGHAAVHALEYIKIDCAKAECMKNNPILVVRSGRISPKDAIKIQAHARHGFLFSANAQNFAFPLDGAKIVQGAHLPHHHAHPKENPNGEPKAQGDRLDGDGRSDATAERSPGAAVPNDQRPQ